MLLKELCPEVIKYTENLIGELRTGGIIGSTEATFSALDAIALASEKCGESFNTYLVEWVPKIIESRPTSQVLVNIIRRFLDEYLKILKDKGTSLAIKSVKDIISNIKNEIMIVKDSIASLGSKRIVEGDVILTHSHSTTVMLLFKKALENGVNFSVIVTESRPIGEGLRTAEELETLGIDTTLIVDSAVRYVMKRVTKVFVGADAVAANGAVVSKIGTSAIALAAKEARVRVYVTAETYKFSLETVFGELIEGVTLSEPRLIMPEEWVSELAGKVVVREPLFDVTPPEYIDAIITEIGVTAPQAVPILIREIYGWPPRIRSINSLLEEVKKYVKE